MTENHDERQNHAADDSLGGQFADSTPENLAQKNDAGEDAASRSWFKSHYLGIPIPTYLWRCEGRRFVLIDYNEAACEITQGKIAGLIGTEAHQYYADLPQILSDFDNCRSGKTVVKREMRYKFRTTGEEMLLLVIYMFLNPDLIIVHTDNITELKKTEDELRESEEKYKTLVELSPQAIAIFQDNKIAFANLAAARLIGYEKTGEVIGLDVLAPVSAEESERLEGYLHKILEGDADSPWNFRTYIIKRDGDRAQIEVFATVISYKGRPAVQFLATDITERNKAEAALRESEERFRAIWEHSPVGICLTDRHGIYHFVNKAYCDIYGYTEPELLGLSFFDKIMAPSDHSADKESYARFFDNPALRPLGETGIFTRKNGDPVTIQFTADFIQQSGLISYMVSMNIDVTEKNKALQALRESEEKYRFLFENASEAIATVDYDGRITLLNRSAAKFLNGSPMDFTGKMFMGFFPADQSQRFLQRIRDVISTSLPYLGEELVTLPDGRRWFKVNLQPIQDNRAPANHAILIASDITAERLLHFRNDARNYLFQCLRKYRDIEKCLECACQAIYHAKLFERAVLTLHDENRTLTHLGQVGLDEEILKKARSAPAPDPELSRRITQDKYRISHSYFIPVEDGLIDDSVRRHIPQRESQAKGPKSWQVGDELFVPLFGSDGNYEGWLSVDTPFDGMRPTVEEITYIEELIDITSKKVHEILSIKNLELERLALQEKNIALREVLIHIEDDKMEFRQKIRASIDQVLLPALKKLLKKDGSISLTYFNILKSGLPELAATTGAPVHLYASLSPREREICIMIKNGASSKEIAETLHIAMATVRKHREVIRRKLGISHINVNLSIYLKSDKPRSVSNT